MVLRVYQGVPERQLFLLRQVDLDPGEGEALETLPVNRAGIHAFANCQGGRNALPARGSGRKCRSRECGRVQRRGAGVKKR